MASVCRSDDRDLQIRSRWVATLSDGGQVFQDDHRHQISTPDSWIRLGDYCRDSGLDIIGLRLQFRVNSVLLPDGKDGYFFARNAFASWGESITYEGFSAGYLDSGVVYVGCWKIPELTLVDFRQREPDFSKPFLIANSGLG